MNKCGKSISQNTLPLLKSVVIKSGGEPEQKIIKGDEIHERVNVKLL